MRRSGIAPLHFPPDANALARGSRTRRIVWAFSDIHGVRSGLLAALVQAGIADIDGAWIAPPGTALVGLGDYIDRGTDSAGRGRPARLAAASRRPKPGRASSCSSAATMSRCSTTCCWGTRRGRWTGCPRAVTRPFARSGTRRTAKAWPGSARAILDHPDLQAVVLDTLPYAVWRDVLFVHAAPPTGIDRLEDLATADEQMWHAATFLASAGIARDPAFQAYRDAGIGRVVLGHVPQPTGPTALHDGTALLLDTNAAAPAKRRQCRRGSRTPRSCASGGARRSTTSKRS